MEYAGHRKIKLFSIDGQIYDDADFPRLREQYQVLIEEYMRIKGYVPHLDLDSAFSTSYNGHSFEFKITWYGIYLGKVKAKCYKGVTGNILIPMSPTMKIRSENSSRSAESKQDQN